MSSNPFLSFSTKSNSVANNFSNSLKYNPFSSNNNNSNSIANLAPAKTSFNPFMDNNSTNIEKNNPFSFLSKSNTLESRNYNPFIKNGNENSKNDNNNLLNFSLS